MSVLRNSIEYSFVCFKCFIINTLLRGPEPKLYPISILRTVLYGEIIWGVDNAYYNDGLCTSNSVLNLT